MKAARAPSTPPTPTLPPTRPAPAGALRGAPTRAVTWLVLLLGAVGLLAAVGQSAAWLPALAVVCDRILFAGGLASLYILAGLGLGRLLLPAPTLSDVRPVAGLACLLWLSHLLGWVGAFQGAVGAWVALAVLVIPAATELTRRLETLRTPKPFPRAGAWSLLTLGGVALLCVACAHAPGWLWDSEFGGYDALSYHLALPQAWLRDGRLACEDWNVYSYLPSAVESAFLHLGRASFASLPAPGSPGGLVAGEGYRALSCQFLAAGLAGVGAWTAGRAAFRAVRVAGFSDAASTLAGRTAAALTLLTPWAIVTGSLAYNDMGVVAMLAGCVLIAAPTDDGPRPWARGLLLGLLAGSACIIKPTALLFVVLPLAPALMLLHPPRSWAALAAGACLSGLVMLAPWLLRDALASGDPVFPAAARWFARSDRSMGHWTPEQIARYANAHHFTGSVLDRLRLLLFPDRAGQGVARWRGLTNMQWGYWWPLPIVGSAILLAIASTHRIAAALLAMLLVQIGAWLAFTHLQSRFLLPILAPSAILAGSLSGVTYDRAPRRERAGAIAALAWLLAALQLGLGTWVFTRQRNGSPNALLTAGIPLRTGTLMTTDANVPPGVRDEWLDIAGPPAFVNVRFAGARVALLGGATPLYYTGPVVASTTWDESDLTRLLASAPADTSRWNAMIRAAGIDVVVVDLGELSRLKHSGWLSPGVDIDAVTRWATTRATVEHAWPGAGVLVVTPRDRNEP